MDSKLLEMNKVPETNYLSLCAFPTGRGSSVLGSTFPVYQSVDLFSCGFLICRNNTTSMLVTDIELGFEGDYMSRG